jgi:PAS domain S-box-containing protein
MKDSFFRDHLNRGHIDTGEIEDHTGGLGSLLSGDQAPAVLVIDPVSSEIKDVNNSALEFYGYSRDDLKSILLSDIIVAGEAETATAIQKVLDGKQNFFLFVHRIAGENIRIVEFYASPVMLRGKTLIFAVIKDVTDKAGDEPAIAESREYLKELNETKDRLFTIIAHDLRSPFNSILGFSELLLENFKEYDTATLEKFIRQINSATKQTMILIENLFDWAKAQTGQIGFKPEILPLRKISNEIIDLLGTQAVLKEIRLKNFVPEIVTIRADYNMLKIILRNLISNAVKFTNPGGMVEIYAIPLNREVEITVSDHGTGMSEETLKSLFDFRKVITKEGTAKEKGSGIGLILCKDLIEKHGGRIRVKSIQGTGTEFIFTLPSAPSF